MFCKFCGKQIEKDSAFCPYCGLSTQEDKCIYCPKCGKRLKKDSKFCSFCGTTITQKSFRKRIKIRFPHINLVRLIRSRFIKLYSLWLIVNCILFINAEDSYSNYFNSTNLTADHGFGLDKGIYPEDWLYPFRNIFNGISGQDPLYVYDITEFVLYVIVLPLLSALMIIWRERIFKSARSSNLFYWIVWYISIWMLVVFPMGLFSLDILGWTFIIGGLIIALYAYNKTVNNLK